MTGQLRSTMQSRADELGDVVLDLDAIVRDGDRRLRRRRVAMATGVAGVLVVGAAVMTTRAHTTDSQPAGHDAKPVTYAVGSVIHTGDRQVDVKVRVHSMVSTAFGFVFTGPDGTVYQAKQGGDVRAIGRIDGSSRLFASDDGLVAAWWDGERIQTWPGYVARGSEERDDEGRTDSLSVAESWPDDAPPRVEALSGGHLWFWNGRHVMVADTRPSASTAVYQDDGLGPDTVRDAAGPRILVRVGGGLGMAKANLYPDTTAELQDWEPGTDLSAVVAQGPDVSTGDLAPDGKHWFSQDADEFAVFDSATGARQAVSHPGFAFAAPYQWLDDDTIAAVARPTTDDQDLSLLTCQVSTNACRVAASDIGTTGDVVVADGRGPGYN